MSFLVPSLSYVLGQHIWDTSQVGRLVRVVRKLEVLSTRRHMHTRRSWEGVCPQGGRSGSPQPGHVVLLLLLFILCTGPSLVQFDPSLRGGGGGSLILPE